MDDLAEYINGLTLHIGIRNWLYRVERASQNKTPDVFMRDLIYSVGAFILSFEGYETNPSIVQIAVVIEAIADFLEVDIQHYHLNNLWGNK